MSSKRCSVFINVEGAVNKKLALPSLPFCPLHTWSFPKTELNELCALLSIMSSPYTAICLSPPRCVTSSLMQSIHLLLVFRCFYVRSLSFIGLLTSICDTLPNHIHCAPEKKQATLIFVEIFYNFWRTLFRNNSRTTKQICAKVYLCGSKTNWNRIIHKMHKICCNDTKHSKSVYLHFCSLSIWIFWIIVFVLLSNFLMSSFLFVSLQLSSV